MMKPINTFLILFLISNTVFSQSIGLSSKWVYIDTYENAQLEVKVEGDTILNDTSCWKLNFELRFSGGEVKSFKEYFRDSDSCLFRWKHGQWLKYMDFTLNVGDQFVSHIYGFASDTVYYYSGCDSLYTFDVFETGTDNLNGIDFNYWSVESTENNYSGNYNIITKVYPTIGILPNHSTSSFYFDNQKCFTEPFMWKLACYTSNEFSYVLNEEMCVKKLAVNDSESVKYFEVLGSKIVFKDAQKHQVAIYNYLGQRLFQTESAIGEIDVSFCQAPAILVIDGRFRVKI